jgi:hypothetical protein
VANVANVEHLMRGSAPFVVWCCVSV